MPRARFCIGEGRAVIVGDDLLDHTLGTKCGVVAIDGPHVDRHGAQPDLAGSLDAALTFSHNWFGLAVDADGQHRYENAVLLDGGQEVAVQPGIEPNVVLDLDVGRVQVQQLGSGRTGHGGFLSLIECVAYRLHHDVSYRQHFGREEMGRFPMSVGRDLLPVMAESRCAPMVVMSYGMGADSTAILLRWLTDPASRDFDFKDLVVITAHTGDEFDQTLRDVDEIVLPLLREHRVRFIQVGRSQRKTTASGEGVVVLEDSTQPDRLHVAGYKLSDEMLSAGTLPQVGGAHVCSIHAKANCLEPVIAAITSGVSYRHVLGFEAGEKARAAKDSLFNTDRRVGWYPLLDWKWDRARCLEFIAMTTNRHWSKSACSYCVFAMTTRAGREAVVNRYRREPWAGARALFLRWWRAVSTSDRR
jgi:hypothetical protein